MFGVRIEIEKLAYEKLSTQLLKDKFIATHKTKSKLEFCEENGITISEIHYLLGLIYNDDLHWHEQRDYETPLISKLDNMTIKKMIQEIFFMTNLTQKFELHYYLKDNSHAMNAFVRNKAEKDFLLKQLKG